MNNAELFNLIKQNRTIGESLVKELRSRKIGIRTLIENGFRVEAVIKYRNDTGCTLKEAHDYINSFIENKL